MNVHHAKPSIIDAEKLKINSKSNKPHFGVYESYKFQLNTSQMVSIHDNNFNHLTAYELGVNRLVKYMKFDVIHAHDWLTFRAALRVKQSTDKPLILHIHSIERDRAGGKPGNPEVREIEYMSMLLADRVIAVSKRVKDSIVADYDIPADKIEVVHNSIDRSMIKPLDTENEYKYLTELKKHGWKVVVNIGRLTVQKGLYHFLRTVYTISCALQQK
jgi:glycosyltransferase involved in cell wall biosynthesis